MAVCWDVVAIVVSFLRQQDLARFMLTCWHGHNLASRHLYTRLIIDEDSKVLRSIDPERTHYAKYIKHLTIKKWAMQKQSQAMLLVRALNQCAAQLVHLDIELLGLDIQMAKVFPHLRALKTTRSSIAKEIIIQSHPQLHALYVQCDTGPTTPDEWVDLSEALRVSSANSLRHLQIFIQASNIITISSELRKIVENFPCLSLLCIEISTPPIPVESYTWPLLKSAVLDAVRKPLPNVRQISLHFIPVPRTQTNAQYEISEDLRSRLPNAAVIEIGWIQWKSGIFRSITSQQSLRNQWQWES